MFAEGSNQESETDRIEALRHILESQQRRTVTYGEALEVGESLISFFQVLATETEDVLAENAA